MNKCTASELKMLGDFWTLAIIQALSDGQKRFCELERAVNVSSPTTLANRLKKLEVQGLILKQKETVDKLSVSYELSPKGYGILPVLEQIHVFARKFLS